MVAKTIVYYNLQLWEELDQDDVPSQLKNKSKDIADKLDGYGMMNFSITTEDKAEQEEETQQQEGEKQ